MIESFYKNFRRLWNLICNFLLSRILWLQVVKCSNVRHFPSPSRICKCCGSCVFFSRLSSYHLSSIVKKGSTVCVQDISLGRGGGLLLTLAPERGKFTYFQLHKKWMPRLTPRGWPGLQMTGMVQWSVFQVMQKKTNEIHIRFSKWCENEKRILKLTSVFQSDAKTKNEIRSSKPFFKVRRKRKTKRKIKNCF